MKLLDIAKEELAKKYQYVPDTFIEANLQETYIMLAELLDPNNSYVYNTICLVFFVYTDNSENEIFVRLIYQPVINPYFELKTWWVNDHGKRIYNEVPPNSSAIDWDKRTNTIAKIFKDEIIPFFKKQDISNEMRLYPVTKSRYVFSIRMIKKFIPSDWKIEEEFPKRIIVTKNV